MTDQNITDYIVPSDPVVRQQIRAKVLEAVGLVDHIAGTRETIKAIRDTVKNDLGVPTKIFNQMVKATHKHKYSEMVADNEAFELFYGNIMEDSSTT
jgi:hypoxanthine phosphoribosyltransferase